MLALLLFAAVQTIEPLSDQQIREAIELGRSGKVPIVRVGPRSDFNVFIEGPVTRIAEAAERAAKQYRPFDVANVTPEMKAPIYRVIAERDESAGNKVIFIQHIVLQPKGAKGMDGVVQPVNEDRRMIREAVFDRLPDGEFDVVLATTAGTQKYSVRLKDREKIR